MSRFSLILVASFVFSALIFGGLPAAHAQCQNGMCPLAGSNQNYVSAPVVPAASVGSVINYRTVVSTVPPLLENTSNVISYSSNIVLPSTISYCAGWSGCSSNCYYYPASWSVPVTSFVPSPVYTTSPTCSGGNCMGGTCSGGTCVIR
jgi:hypothetical protein